MEFKAVTLSNTRPAAKPAASRTDTQRALFVRQFKQSGQTQLAFCKARGINSKTFAGWLKRFPLHGISRLPLSLQRQVQPAMKFGRHVKVCLPGGVRVELKAVFNQSSMVSFLQELAQCTLN
jgi:hypothetical protein